MDIWKILGTLCLGFGLWAVLVLNSCNDCGGRDDDILDVYSTNINCDILNPEGLSVIGTEYDHEQINVLDENNLEPLLLSIEEGGSLSFIYPDREDPLDSLLSKRFYVHFPMNNYHPASDVDTIDITYQLTEGQCGVVFKNWEYHYNGTLYTTESLYDTVEFIKE